MFKKIILCFIGVLSMYAWMPAVNDIPMINTAQAQEQEQHIWFYSRDGMDFWITHAEKLAENKYEASIVQTHDGKMGTFHICDVMYNDGLAYISYYNRMNGTWGEWEHLDIAEALWKALVGNC